MEGIRNVTQSAQAAASDPGIALTVTPHSPDCQVYLNLVFIPPLK